MSITEEERHASLRQHPYLIQGEGQDFRVIPNKMTYHVNIDKIVDIGSLLLNQHARNPIDLLVGDDVSGRIPTLIAHRLLRYAREDGLVDTPPRTVFMASGNKPKTRNLYSRWSTERTWQKNLHDHAKQLVATHATNRVVIITENVSKGKSIRRLEDAFEVSGVKDVSRLNFISKELYLNGTEVVSDDRKAVGVEKYPPEATSRRHPEFDGAKSAGLRHFLDDYSEAIYQIIQDREQQS
jgi:hypothetical protein